MYSAVHVIFSLAMVAAFIAMLKPTWFHWIYKDLTRKHAVIAFFAIFLILASPFGSWLRAGVSRESAVLVDAKKEEEAKKAEVKKAEDAKNAEQKAKADAEQKIAELNKLKDNIKFNLESLLPLVKGTGVELRKEGIDGINKELLLFSGLVATIEEARMSGDEALMKSANELEKELSVAQAGEFPLMRKAFSEDLDKKVWEYDLDARVFGNGNTNLELVGAVFAANKNIKTIQTTLDAKLKELRFKRVNYKWYSGASEYDYYDIDSPKDTDVLLKKPE